MYLLQPLIEDTHVLVAILMNCTVIVPVLGQIAAFDLGLQCLAILQQFLDTLAGIDLFLGKVICFLYIYMGKMLKNHFLIMY